MLFNDHSSTMGKMCKDHIVLVDDPKNHLYSKNIHVQEMQVDKLKTKWHRKL